MNNTTADFVVKKYFVQKTVDGWVVKEDKSDTTIATFHDSLVSDAEKLARDLTLKLNTAERKINFDECRESLYKVCVCAHNLYSGVKLLKDHIKNSGKDILDISVTCDSDDFMAAYLHNHFDKLRKAVEEVPTRERMEDAFRFKDEK